MLFISFHILAVSVSKLEKLSNTFTTKHKTQYNYTLVEQHFYDVIQNRIQLHFGEPKKGVTNLKTQDQKG